LLPVTKKPGTLAGRCLLETKADILTSGLTAPIVGHVGDGNFHLGILFDPQDAVETERAEALAFRTARRAIAMGGTCSGEHGVGLHKIVHMQMEHGVGVALMKAVKTALDPNGIMNPGKIYPTPLRHCGKVFSGAFGKSKDTESRIPRKFAKTISLCAVRRRYAPAGPPSPARDRHPAATSVKS
jgi:hypothetical protein